MAYICTHNIECADCIHYRYDNEKESFACFAQIDEQDGIVFAENKEAIVKALLPVLQLTNNLSDLVSLKYVKDEKNDDETVIAVFANGSKKVANVTMDSGTSLIRDVIKQIV